MTVALLYQTISWTDVSNGAIFSSNISLSTASTDKSPPTPQPNVTSGYSPSLLLVEDLSEHVICGLEPRHTTIAKGGRGVECPSRGCLPLFTMRYTSVFGKWQSRFKKYSVWICVWFFTELGLWQKDHTLLTKVGDARIPVHAAAVAWASVRHFPVVVVVSPGQVVYVPQRVAWRELRPYILPHLPKLLFGVPVGWVIWLLIGLPDTISVFFSGPCSWRLLFSHQQVGT